MINKELFVETINFMKERNDATLRLNDVLKDEFVDSNIFPYCKYDNQIIKLLANGFDYDDNIMEDWITYFCYEKDFGRYTKLGPIVIKNNKENKEYNIDTPEQLYDFLYEEACSIAKV